MIQLMKFKTSTKTAVALSRMSPTLNFTSPHRLFNPNFTSLLAVLLPSLRLLPPSFFLPFLFIPHRTLLLHVLALSS